MEKFMIGFCFVAIFVCGGITGWDSARDNIETKCLKYTKITINGSEYSCNYINTKNNGH